MIWIEFHIFQQGSTIDYRSNTHFTSTSSFTNMYNTKYTYTNSIQSKNYVGCDNFQFLKWFHSENWLIAQPSIFK